MTFATLLVVSFIYTAGLIGVLDPRVDPTDALTFTHLFR